MYSLKRKEFLVFFGATVMLHVLLVVTLMAKSAGAAIKPNASVELWNFLIDCLLPLNSIWPAGVVRIGEVFYVLLNGLLFSFLPAFAIFVLLMRTKTRRLR